MIDDYGERIMIKFIAIVMVTLMIGCSSVDSRISSNQAEFDTYPVEVKSAIRRGEILLGFTPNQVRMSWGSPSNTAREISETEGERIQWRYRSSSPTMSFGVGVGSGGRHRTGAGVGMSTSSSDQGYEKIAIFAEDRVVEILYFD
jgi:hypothetical protein